MAILSEKKGNREVLNDVHQRLLDVAEKFFCEKGFDETGVRELTREAGCNIAAVNYHFGGKNKLYAAMFRRHMEKLFDRQRKNVEEIMQSKEPTLEKLLRKTIKTAMEPLTGGDGQIPLLKLMVRETLNPHLREEVVAYDIVRDFLILFRDSLMKLFPGLGPEKAMMCVFSLEGAILHPLLFFKFYKEHHPDLEIDDLIEHIIEFAAAGIRKAVK